VTVTSTSIDIAAPAATIFALAAATERWPLILPHYRYVRVREREGDRRIVEMAAWRHVFPLHWIALQTNDAARPHIAFRHLAGPVRGMDVEWTFEQHAQLTRVTIVHRLEFAFPVLGPFVGKSIVGEYFIAGVAAQTLGCMKRIAEAAITG
jgi:ribosome-associated toxin RatA of RatAB toxin-antitoxin module